MGFVTVEMDVASLAEPERRARVRFLADSGAMYTLLPEAIVRQLRLKPVEQTVLQVADGRRIRRQLGDARFYFRGKQRIATVILGKRKDPALLGVTTLEAFRLEVDPVRRRVKPMPLLLYSVNPGQVAGALVAV